MKKISILSAALALAVSFAAPLVALAATGGINLGAIRPYSDGIIDGINTILVPVIIAIAFITFLWGVYKYFILGAADEDAQRNGRQFILWGIIGFVVILSVWGLVNVVGGLLDLPGTTPTPPTFVTP